MAKMRTKFKKERTINHNKGWGCVVAQPLNTSKRCKRCGRGGESGSHKNKNKTCDSCIFVNYRNSLLSIILASSHLHSSLVLCERTLVQILYYQPMNIDPFVLPLQHSLPLSRRLPHPLLISFLFALHRSASQLLLGAVNTILPPYLTGYIF